MSSACVEASSALAIPGPADAALPVATRLKNTPLATYLRAKASGSRNVQLAMAVFLLAVVVSMSVGTARYALWVRRHT